MALAGDDTTELLVLLDPARADIDGDGLVSPGEAITFKELLGILTPEDPVLAQIVIAYGYAMDKGGVSPVDLTLLLEKAVTGAEAEEFALAALPPPCPCMAFTRGDANNSNTVDIADEIYILSFLFQSGSAPVPLDSGDANDDGMIDVADAIYISSYLFSQVEPKPPLPFGPHGGPYFEGLDPTPDALNGSCDLRVGNFAEFAPAVAHIDMSGDGKEDAVWVTPDGDMWCEFEGTHEDVVFEDDFSDTGLRVFSVAVSRTGVIYGITDSISGVVYVLDDNDGDGRADSKVFFQLGREILDAALVDVSLPGTSTEAQALVLLHQVNGKEAFTICKDSNGDGYIDATGAVFVQGNMLDNVRGIAVDGRTARIFVSGMRIVDNVPVPAVVYYRDNLCNGVTPGGDKRIDAGSGILYYNESPTAPDPDYEFPAIHYLPYEKTLYILAVKADYRTSLICVMDTDDDVWSWQQSCRSDLKQADPANPPAYLNVFAFDKEGTHYIEASVTMADGWTVWEYLAVAGTGCSCWQGVVPVVFSLPDAALAAMKTPVCYAYVIQIDGDYPATANSVWDQSGFDVPRTRANFTENDGNNRRMAVYYDSMASGSCGSKTAASHAYAKDSRFPWTIGYAVYGWFNASNPQAHASEIWAVSNTRWGLNIQGCPDNPGVQDYPIWPGQVTTWYFDGSIVLEGVDFDVFENHALFAADAVRVTYREWFMTGGYNIDYKAWEGDDRQGTHNTTYADYGGGFAPVAGPGMPFTVDVQLNVDADRDDTSFFGAGRDEWGDARMANGQAYPENTALKTFFRIRCR
jgi:hypothetical protein